jgi:hypothetical protein
MHVLDRRHLPHTIVAGVAAAVLAILITLVLAAGLGDVSQAGSSTATLNRTAAAASASRGTPTRRGTPLTAPLGAPLRQPWSTTRRSRS